MKNITLFLLVLGSTYAFSAEDKALMSCLAPKEEVIIISRDLKDGKMPLMFAVRGDKEILLKTNVEHRAENVKSRYLIRLTGENVEISYPLARFAEYLKRPHTKAFLAADGILDGQKMSMECRLLNQ